MLAEESMDGVSVSGSIMKRSNKKNVKFQSPDPNSQSKSSMSY